MSNLYQPQPSMLQALGIDPPRLRFTVPRWQLHVYIMVAHYLRECELDATLSELERIHFYLAACQHLCEIKVWNKIGILLLTPLDSSIGQTLYQQLIDWQLEQELLDLCSTLLGKLDRKMDAFCYSGLGHSYKGFAQPEKAREYFQKSITLFREEGLWKEAAWARYWLGNLELFATGYKEALQHYQEALQEFYRLKDEKGIAHLSHNLAAVALQQGDYAEARHYFQQSSDILIHVFKERDAVECAWLYRSYGEYLVGQGEFLEAQKYLHRSWRMFKQLEHEGGQHWASIHLVGLMIDRKKYDAARLLLKNVPTNMHSLKEAGATTAWACYNWGRLALESNEYQQAEQYFQFMLQIMQKLETQSGLLRALESLAYIYVSRHESERAAHLLGAAEGLRQQLQEVMTPVAKRNHEQRIASLSSLMDEVSLQRAWANGQTMPLEQVIALEINENP